MIIKNSLTILLVLAMISAAGANMAPAWFEVDPADAKDGYDPGDTIGINLVADLPVYGVHIGGITSDNGGTAQNPLVLNPALQVTASPGTIVNSEGILVEFIIGMTSFGFPPVPAGVPLHSFEYHVPDVPASTYITIDDYDMEGVPPLGPLLDFGDFGPIPSICALTIHVPEPMTIALLGLGGLFLRRRR